MAARGAQHLLRRPERVAGCRRMHQRELRKVDAAGGERGRVRQVRRRKPCDAPARPGKRGERRQHELKLADARPHDQKLGQGAVGPAAAGKLAVKRREAGGRGRCTGRQPSATPDWVPLENVVQRRHGCITLTVFIYSIDAAGKLAVLPYHSVPSGQVENKSRMLRAAFACLLALCSCAALAEDSVHVWLDPGFFSYHFSNGNFRQDNYGVGVGVFVAPEHGFLAGTFFNSNDERSHYAAYHWRPWGRTTGDLSVRAGLAFGAIDGYSNTNNGGWFPLILPALSAEYGHFGANLILAPHPKNGTALALQLRLRVW